MVVRGQGRGWQGCARDKAAGGPRTALGLSTSEPPSAQRSPLHCPPTPPNSRAASQSRRRERPQEEPGTGRGFGLKLQVWGPGRQEATLLPAGLVS